MSSEPIAVQCPFTSSLREFRGYWAGSGIPGPPPMLVSTAFPCASISRSFPIHSSSPALDFIRVPYLRPTYLQPFGRPFDFLSEFPGLGLALVTDVVVQEVEQGCA